MIGKIVRTALLVGMALVLAACELGDESGDTAALREQLASKDAQIASLQAQVAAQGGQPVTPAQIAGQTVIAAAAAQRARPVGMRHLKDEAVVIGQPPNQSEVQHNPPGCVLLFWSHSDELLQATGCHSVGPRLPQYAGHSVKGCRYIAPHLSQIASSLQSEAQAFLSLGAANLA